MRLCLGDSYFCCAIVKHLSLWLFKTKSLICLTEDLYFNHLTLHSIFTCPEPMFPVGLIAGALGDALHHNSIKVFYQGMLQSSPLTTACSIK